MFFLFTIYPIHTADKTHLIRYNPPERWRFPGFALKVLPLLTTSASFSYKGSQRWQKTDFTTERFKKRRTVCIESDIYTDRGMQIRTFLQARRLPRHYPTICIVIINTICNTIVTLCNDRTMLRYCDTSGHRAWNASYCGHFYIERRLGPQRSCLLPRRSSWHINKSLHSYSCWLHVTSRSLRESKQKKL